MLLLTWKILLLLGQNLWSSSLQEDVGGVYSRETSRAKSLLKYCRRSCGTRPLETHRTDFKASEYTFLACEYRRRNIFHSNKGRPSVMIYPHRDCYSIVTTNPQPRERQVGSDKTNSDKDTEKKVKKTHGMMVSLVLWQLAALQEHFR